MIDNEDFCLAIRDIVEELKSINSNLEKLNETLNSSIDVNCNF